MSQLCLCPGRAVQAWKGVVCSESQMFRGVFPFDGGGRISSGEGLLKDSKVRETHMAAQRSHVQRFYGKLARASIQIAAQGLHI